MGREQLLGAAVAVIGVAVVAVGGYTLAHPSAASSDAAAVVTASSGPAAVATASSGASAVAAQTVATEIPAPSSVQAPVSTSVTASSAAASRASSVTPLPRTSQATSAVPDVKAPLVVLNNTTTAGLAGRAAARFRDAGWPVTSVGNLRDDILSSCAYYDRDQSGAQDAAAALAAQFPGLKRIAPKFSGLPAGPVIVVLTPDWD